MAEQMPVVRTGDGNMLLLDSARPGNPQRASTSPFPVSRARNGKKATTGSDKVTPHARLLNSDDIDVQILELFHEERRASR
eukprot:9420310-Alexandrium_andersonii.AAC.1